MFAGRILTLPPIRSHCLAANRSQAGFPSLSAIEKWG